MRRICLIFTVWSILSAVGSAQAPTARLKPDDKNTAIDPQAMATLNKMTNFLKTLKTYKIRSEASTDEIVDTNMKIQKDRSG